MYPKSAADIYEALPKKSVDFVFDEIKGTNKEAKRKLLKAKNESKVETKSFDDADIDLLTFDWVSVDMDRNWWWQVQALPFLGWFAQSYKLFDPPEQLEMLTYCLEATEQWIRQEDKADQSPLRWHDHATAYRLTNFVHGLVAVSTDCQLIQLVFDNEKRVPFADIITQHVKWLMQDENYSKHTNHGFDQAMAVFSLGLLVEKNFWLKDVELAENRLVDEVRFAFTEEGVHKENSPGYHVFMMRRLEKLVRLERLGETTVGIEARKIQEGAERFLEAITLPDGTLPMIGDTRGGQKGKLTEVPEGPAVYDFSESGYVVVKGKFSGKSYYLLMKNCHDSNYHRHDDDLHLFLFYNNQVILGDGGLGSHNESDPRRVELRSHKAHNVPFVEARKFGRDRSKLKSVPKLEIIGGLMLKGRTFSQSVLVERTVELGELSRGVIKVVDTVSEGTVSQNIVSGTIQVPTDCTANKDRIEVKLSCGFKADIYGLKSYSHQRLWVSEEYGRYLKSDRLELSSSSNSMAVVYRFPGSLSE